MTDKPNPAAEPVSPAQALRVRRMRVIWRDTFIIEHYAQPERPDYVAQGLERVRKLPCYVADISADEKGAPELLRVIERVSRSVAAGGYANLARFQLAPLRIANLRPALKRWRCPPSDLKPDQVRTAAAQADSEQTWIEITPMLLLHRAGVGIMEYYASVDAPQAEPRPPVKVLAGEKLSGAAVSAPVDAPPLPGYAAPEAVEIVRMGIQPQLVSAGAPWRTMLPEGDPDWHFYSMVEAGPDGHVFVGGLRDLSQLISAHVATPVPTGRKKDEPRAQDLHPPRPTGSTTVVLIDTDPAPGEDLVAFVKEHAYPLRGVGAMDSFYLERAQRIVERELGDNLSSDAETAVYLLGNSELILFNNQLAGIAQNTRRRLGLSSDDIAATYIYMHYVVLLEWVYLQEAILRSYIQQLDALAAAPRLLRRKMIATLRGALEDLIQYQENITSYTTRIEFLERASIYHKLDQLAERFEHKQDLLLTYSSEYNDFREARAAEFLNWLAAILAGGELGNLVVNAAGIQPEQNVPLYLTVTLGSIGLAILVMVVLRISARR